MNFFQRENSTLLTLVIKFQKGEQHAFDIGDKIPKGRIARF
jgi:hypothetical protein